MTNAVAYGKANFNYKESIKQKALLVEMKQSLVVATYSNTKRLLTVPAESIAGQIHAIHEGVVCYLRFHQSVVD